MTTRHSFALRVCTLECDTRPALDLQDFLHVMHMYSGNSAFLILRLVRALAFCPLVRGVEAGGANDCVNEIWNISGLMRPDIVLVGCEQL